MYSLSDVILAEVELDLLTGILVLSVLLDSQADRLRKREDLKIDSWVTFRRFLRALLLMRHRHSLVKARAPCFL